MKNYSGSERGTTKTHLFQGTKSAHHLPTTPAPEKIEAMGTGGTSEFIVDQGLCYPAATNYGYYCTGFESPSEWDDHNRFFGLDGPDPHYTGTQIESLPYVYYTPSYGYAQSPYNPYNPYIPGAIVGVDGSIIGTQQYYTGTYYEHPASLPTYVPLVIQPRPDNIPNSSLTPHLLNSGASNANRPEGLSLKHSPPSAFVDITKALPKPPLGDVKVEPVYSVSNLTRSSTKISEGSKANAVLCKQPTVHTSTTSGNGSHSSSTYVTQGRSAFGSTQAAGQFLVGRDSSLRNSFKVALPVANGVSDLGMDARGCAAVDKLRPRLHYGGVLMNGNGGPDLLSEQNRGPRTNKSKSQWMPSTSVKSYGTEAGASNAQGNVIIYSDQYNREDFSINYASAKFFIIKSYSEDDVHKSIKYNVWSSTPNGNKRLDGAYEDAQRISAGKPSGCPIFLFFSVNASGQFCGVAEMIGPVDFFKDMNFWQQDKWSGSFPVKWHIIKDVPNTNFRHIILENNDNKPVTNSRDTQEIRYRQGIEILNIFKNYASKTSLLDDFMYYEDRQKIMLEDKARVLGRSYNIIPSFVPPYKLNGLVDLSLSTDEKPIKQSDRNSSGKTVTSVNKQFPLKPDVTNSLSSEQDDTKHNLVGNTDDATSVLKISSLTIDPKQADAKSSATAASIMDSGMVDVVTVGSMPVKVNRFTEASSRTLTVGTILINTEALKLVKPGPFTTGSV